MKIKETTLGPNEVRCVHCKLVLELEPGDVFITTIATNSDHDEIDVYAAKCSNCQKSILIDESGHIRRFYDKDKETIKAELRNLLSNVANFFVDGQYEAAYGISKIATEHLRKLAFNIK